MQETEDGQSKQKQMNKWNWTELKLTSQQIISIYVRTVCVSVRDWGVDADLLLIRLCWYNAI